MRTVVALAGLSGSGKSTIAKRLESDYGYARASFGDVVRVQAGIRGAASDTPSLEAVGRSLIAEWGWDRFCAEVLAGTQGAPRVVIDGIRHRAALDALRRTIAPDDVNLVFVEVDEHLRNQRLLARGGGGATPAMGQMNGELASLRESAALVVNGLGSSAVDDIVGRWK